ncbi:hypothetical protein Pla52n_24970 [Stieleria varia]|uniref:Uncharacterized protein n=1 Tax=Stieleria varia TaxID=2528005 RepID=A0A5C6AZK3_9BACT|nr:hypothetical protein Pla52n_24970 [Stieleria varia]
MFDRRRNGKPRGKSVLGNDRPERPQHDPNDSGVASGKLLHRTLERPCKMRKVLRRGPLTQSLVIVLADHLDKGL